MNIPIYRAKKIDSDEYVVGYLHSETLDYTPPSKEGKDNYGTKEEEFFIMSKNSYNNGCIDPSTLAIHFPDMLDSNDKPIFASLSESGKGGDIIINKYSNNTLTLFYYGCGTTIKTEGMYNHYKVIGIQN